MSDIEVTSNIMIGNFIAHYDDILADSWQSALQAWQARLKSYPAQRGLRTNIATRQKTSDVRYQRKGPNSPDSLGGSATGVQIDRNTLQLGGIYYTKYVIEERESPESLVGVTIWPDMEQEAVHNAITHFTETFIKEAIS